MKKIILREGDAEFIAKQSLEAPIYFLKPAQPKAQQTHEAKKAHNHEKRAAQPVLA